VCVWGCVCVCVCVFGRERKSVGVYERLISFQPPPLFVELRDALSLTHPHTTTHTHSLSPTHSLYLSLTIHMEIGVSYGVATVSRIDKIIGLFCRISSLL